MRTSEERPKLRVRYGGALAALLLGPVLLRVDVEAHQATEAAGTPLAAECTVAPRPEDELRALATTGYATAAAFLTERTAAGTPRTAATPLATPAAADEPDTTPTVETPADAATIAAVTETIEQLVACSRDGNLPAAAAVFTDTGAANYLGSAIVVFVQINTGSATPPTALDPALLDAFLATLAFPVSPPREAQLILYEVREVVVLPDGRVRANVLVSAGDREPGEDSIVLREQAGRYRIEFGDERDDGSGATPTTATPVA